jgi:hypothetical protein
MQNQEEIETLGDDIRAKRHELEWGELDLARELRSVFNEAATKTYTSDDIVNWEKNKTYPTPQELEALIQVLIFKNKNVNDKEVAESEFRELYQKTKKAFDAGILKIGESYLGDKITELRAGETEVKLADKIKLTARKVTVPEISAVECGKVYDQELFNAIVDVYRNGEVTKPPLTEEQAKSLKERYAQLEPDKAGRPRNLYEAYRRLLEVCREHNQIMSDDCYDMKKFIASPYAFLAQINERMMGEQDKEKYTELYKVVEQKLEAYQSKENTLKDQGRYLLSNINPDYLGIKLSEVEIEQLFCTPFYLSVVTPQGKPDSEKLKNAVEKVKPYHGTDDEHKKHVDNWVKLKTALLSELSPFERVVQILR